MRRCLPCKDIIEFETAPDRIKQIIESAGSQMAGLQYVDHTDGSIKKVSYMAKKDYSFAYFPSQYVIRLYNVNKFQRDSQGNKTTRGCWELIPLNDVVQVTVKGKRFKIQR